MKKHKNHIYKILLSALLVKYLLLSGLRISYRICYASVYMYAVWHIKDLLSNMELCENDTYDKSNLDTLPLSEKKYPPHPFP